MKQSILNAKTLIKNYKRKKTRSKKNSDLKELEKII